MRITSGKRASALTEESQSIASTSEKSPRKIKNILLVAPDVSVDDFWTEIAQLGNRRPRIALFVSQDDRALRLSRTIAGGVQRIGDINPDEEPNRSEFARQGILVFDLAHLQGNAHSRAFEDITSVMGMIERRLAAGQQLASSSDVVQ